jgi:hypothetical protein
VKVLFKSVSSFSINTVNPLVDNALVIIFNNVVLSDLIVPFIVINKSCFIVQTSSNIYKKLNREFVLYTYKNYFHILYYHNLF